MAGTLFVVATPIGHLDDITLRALRVLREVAIVAAEDTRRTGNLLRHFGIPTRLISLHAHNEHTRSARLLDLLSQGQSIALVSDAGTPGISDPGAGLVGLARSRGFRIEPIPGPSAVAAAMSVSGLDGTFAFMGFPPSRAKDRIAWISRCQRVSNELAIVFFEAPHRIRRTLDQLNYLGEQPIFIFRELTKVHEETLVGTTAELLATLTEPQGEFTVVIPRASAQESAQQTIDKQLILNEFGHLTTKLSASRRAVAREVGRKFGLSTRQIYELTKDQAG
ncbi:MAG TPA: 16S rRNA (cytidine(1402)-2'-O)-methyltransferase [Gemmatimonadales bacterium]|nr:16S rRNA (cytidine(1402)-2'-O)-methyltransferase [Gemmatimonadales bacterium]